MSVVNQLRYAPAPLRDRVVRETAPTLREMAPGERPQERLESHGAGALSDTELLAMLLRSGSAGMDVLKVSSALLAAAGSLSALLAWKAEDFRQVKGIGRVKALQLLTVMEIARRVVAQAAAHETVCLSTPQAIHRHFLPLLAGLEVEKFWVLCLNRKYRLLKRIEITSGTATSSLAHPREVFREAIRANASAIVVVHNHPSGDPAPSKADVEVTRQLREAAEIVSIDLLDHVIVGQLGADPQGIGYFSFRNAGLLT
ncbi:MAG TPA: DNA repair protein RadC [Opitutales bacterium]|nr:DNA repair protein RadC [Opitutales bacterium]